VIQPQHDTESAKKDAQPQARQNPFGAFWRWITHDAITFFTVGLFLFTAALAVSTIGLWRTTSRSVALGRDEFNATHRPEIVAHSFEHATIADEERRIGVTFTYVNAGATRAKIIAIASTIVPISGAPRPGINLRIERFHEKWLSGGEWGFYAINSNIRESAAIVQSKRDERGYPTAQFLCIGYIVYEDMSGRRRQTGFCRRYDADTRTWLRVDNTDYEYAY
jgi:hypothetical protein